MRIYLRQHRGRLSPENAKKGKTRKISLYLVFDYGIIANSKTNYIYILNLI
jgi:hypothetical protein